VSEHPTPKPPPPPSKPPFACVKKLAGYYGVRIAWCARAGEDNELMLESPIYAYDVYRHNRPPSLMICRECVAAIEHALETGELKR